MGMKLVYNNGAWQNSHAQRAALPDTIYSCLASNGKKCISYVRKYPPPPSFGSTWTRSSKCLLFKTLHYNMYKPINFRSGLLSECQMV